jgi:DNA-binding response OmpR family regulator
MASASDAGRSSPLVTLAQTASSQSETITYQTASSSFCGLSAAVVLVRNPGRAFHRADLLDTLWGETYDGGDRAVDNLILRLRKKLGPLGSAIETVWSVGYRLRLEKSSQQVS